MNVYTFYITYMHTHIWWSQKYTHGGAIYVGTSEEQAGFRKDRNTIQLILILRLIAGEKKGKKGVSLLHRLSKCI